MRVERGLFGVGVALLLGCSGAGGGGGGGGGGSGGQGGGSASGGSGGQGGGSASGGSGGQGGGSASGGSGGGVAVVGTWSSIEITGAASYRSNYIAVWTGTEILVWGGEIGTTTPTNSGRIYNPATNQWRAMATAGTGAGVCGQVGFWDGTDFVVWGGVSTSPCGFKYNPSTNSWKAANHQNAPEPLTDAFRNAVWTGKYLVALGKNGWFRRYDSALDTWSTMANRTYREGSAKAWSGTEVFVVGGYASATSITPDKTVEAYNPATDQWRSVPDMATGRSAVAVWAGGKLIVWGGTGGTGGEVYDPGSNAWTGLSTAGAPTPNVDLFMAWTGTRVIVWGGDEADWGGGLYDPSTNSWVRFTSVGAPVARRSVAPVWTGSQLFVWGGAGSGMGSYAGLFGDGAMLTP